MAIRLKIHPLSLFFLDFQTNINEKNRTSRVQEVENCWPFGIQPKGRSRRHQSSQINPEIPDIGRDVGRINFEVTPNSTL